VVGEFEAAVWPVLRIRPVVKAAIGERSTQALVADGPRILDFDAGMADRTDGNGQRNIGVSVYDRAQVDIFEMVASRDSIMKITDTVARNAALRQWAAPRNGAPLAAQRLFVGRDPSKSAVLNLSDRDGKPRLRLVVDSLGAARIEFLDAAGKITNTVGAVR
jgi:hypothetical protein